MKRRRFRFANFVLTARWNEQKAEEPVELMLYENIGSDPWDNSGISAKDFKKALDELPHDRDLHLRVNSRGGDVHEGMAMMAAIDEWPKKVTATIDGVAASTASWMILAADEVRARKTSQMFIHPPFAYGMGNAEDFRKTADDLDKTAGQIAGLYAEQTGMSIKECQQLMNDETLLTGEEAEEMGLVDELVDGPAIHNFAPRELETMKNKLSVLYNSAGTGRPGNGKTTTQEIMNKKKVIAILNANGLKEWEGKTISEETSDEQLEAALNHVLNQKKKEEPPKQQQQQQPADPSEKIIKLEKQIAQLTEANDSARKLRITNEVKELVAQDIVPANLEEKAIARALKDETYLNELKAMPARPPGAAPLRAGSVEPGSESFKDVQNFILENGPNFMKNFIGGRAADTLMNKEVCTEIRDRALKRARVLNKHRQMMVEMYNTNTIDAGLQRQIILQEMLEEYAVVLLPLQAFSTVFNNVPLEGTDEVDVPFYPLQTAGSNSWNAATGYNTIADTTTNTRPVKVGGSGAAAGANTAQARKYIGFKFSSYELRRQPYLNVQKLAIQNANKLGVDIFSDIVSSCINNANYGASGKAVAAAQFSGDDIADLWENATGRNWPDRGRSLVLNHTYKTPLLKDPTFKQYLSAGTTDALRKAQIQNAYGFEDIHTVPNLTNYSPAGEHLVGWINHLYALLVATSPIMPTEDVRQLMTRYDVVVHPSLGIAFEYRRFGDTTLDLTKEIVECSYGANIGVATALQRLTSQ